MSECLNKPLHMCCDRGNSLITSAKAFSKANCLTGTTQAPPSAGRICLTQSHTTSWSLNQASSISPAPASGSHIKGVMISLSGSFDTDFTKHRGALQVDRHNLRAPSNYLLADAHSRQLEQAHYQAECYHALQQKSVSI